jgi:hypothetical protein
LGKYALLIENVKVLFESINSGLHPIKPVNTLNNREMTIIAEIGFFENYSNKAFA